MNTEVNDQPLQLIATEQFIQSMRDSGYRSPGWAACEFLDNSMEAKATKIGVYVREGTVSRSVRTAKTVTDIFFLDNGVGMSMDVLKTAPMWGGSSRHNERGFLGRFGVGGPGAASSMSEVFSWTSKPADGAFMKLEISIPQCAAGGYTDDRGRVCVPTPKAADLPDDVLAYAESIGLDFSNGGTVVHISAPDRLNRGGFQKPESLTAKFLEQFGLIYRHLLKDYEIYVGEQMVAPADPLFLMPNALHHDIGSKLNANALPSSVFEMKHETSDGTLRTGKVEIRYSWMQRPNNEAKLAGFQHQVDGQIHRGRRALMSNTNSCNLIVCRKGRQIDTVNRPSADLGGGNKKAWTTPMNNDVYWAVEVNFDPELDELFGVSVNKQGVSISEPVWDRLVDAGVPASIATLKKLSGEQAKIAVAKLKEDPSRSALVITALNEVLEESSDSRAIRSPVIEEQAEQSLEKSIQEEHKKDPKSDVKEIRDQQIGMAEKMGFHAEFENAPEGPMYRPQKWGGTTRVYINREHKFYNSIWNRPGVDDSVKDLALLFFMVLSEREVIQTEDKRRFYAQERERWSMLLRDALEKIEGVTGLDEIMLDLEESEEARLEVES
jgi:hypothetical protein